MNWKDCLEIGAAVVASLGGGGIVVGTIVHFCGERLAEMFSKRYELKMQKELEKYRSNIENKIYISKTKFDTEFELYRNLSTAFSQMVKMISVLFPYGYSTVPADEDEYEEYENNIYEMAKRAVVDAQDLLASNIPFMPEYIYDGYSALLKDCGGQLSTYEFVYYMDSSSDEGEVAKTKADARKKTHEINENWKKQNISIRDYLSKIDVLE